jgi:hypothetical protein
MRIGGFWFTVTVLAAFLAAALYFFSQLGG